MHASLASALLLSGAATAWAQLPSASTRALGMGDNYTAVARGYAAVSWNPAMLGLSGNPGMSLALLPVRGVGGLGPVGLSDIKKYQGEYVPDAVRNQWLQSIQSKGSEEGTGGGDATLMALQVSRFALQVGTTMRAVSNLAPGAAELLLFGNAGRTGTPETISLNNSSVSAHAETTVGVSYAIPLASSAAGQTSIGVTAKYTIGHLLLMGMDQGSTVTQDPSVNLKFPVVGTSTDNFNANGGHGVGIDIGIATRHNQLTLAAVVQNVMNSFKWDESKLRYREGVATFNGTDNTSNFDEQAYANAPAALKTLVEDAKFKPAVGAGAAMEVSKRLTLSADFRTRLGDASIENEPKLHAGVGAELRVIPLIPIRVGAAVVTGGFEAGGGLGLNLGPLNLAASIASRSSDHGTSVVSMFTLISTTGR